MPYKTADRVYETSVTTGVGDYALDGAQVGFQSFVAGIGANNTCPYFATDGINWEVGVGTVITGPNRLQRTTIVASSNAGAAVNWGAGTRKIRCGMPAANSPRNAVESRTANTQLAQADFAKTIIITSGTFSQMFAAAAALGDGWWCQYRNTGSGTVTLDPNGAETIDGATTVTLSPGEGCVIACNGTSFFTVGRVHTVLNTGSTTALALGTSGGTQVQVTDTPSASRSVTLTGSNGGNPTISVSAGNLAITPQLVCGSNITIPSTNAFYFDGGNDTSMSETSANVLDLIAGGNTILRISGTAGGLFTNSGSGALPLQLTQSHASNPLGLYINYSASAPNDTAHNFFHCYDTGATRIDGRSNGGIANFSANNVNLSDERLKQNFSAVASPLRKIAKLFGSLIEEGEYIDAPGRRVLTMRAQRVEQAGLDRFVDRNSQHGLALMRGLHEQQIDMVFRGAVGEALAWADDVVTPALDDYRGRLERIERHLNLN